MRQYRTLQWTWWISIEGTLARGYKHIFHAVEWHFAYSWWLCHLEVRNQPDQKWASTLPPEHYIRYAEWFCSAKQPDLIDDHIRAMEWEKNPKLQTYLNPSWRPSGVLRFSSGVNNVCHPLPHYCLLPLPWKRGGIFWNCSKEGDKIYCPSDACQSLDGRQGSAGGVWGLRRDARWQDDGTELKGARPGLLTSLSGLPWPHLLRISCVEPRVVRPEFALLP